MNKKNVFFIMLVLVRRSVLADHFGMVQVLKTFVAQRHLQTVTVDTCWPFGKIIFVIRLIPIFPTVCVVRLICLWKIITSSLILIFIIVNNNYFIYVFQTTTRNCWKICPPQVYPFLFVHMLDNRKLGTDRHLY